MRKIDITGKVFGMLTVVRLLPAVKKRTIWECKCECGNLKKAGYNDLIYGKTWCCGCQHQMPSGINNKAFKHGLSTHRLHTIWRSMMTRCYNSKSRAYKNYGAKGIKVCERWHTFIDFYNDVIDGYSHNLTIDRFPNKKGNYEPGNFRWANNQMQGRNKNDTKEYYFRNGYRCVPEIAEMTGIGKDVLYGRLRAGDSIEIAVNKGIKEFPVTIEYQGERRTIKELSEMTGITIVTLRNRYNAGLSLELMLKKPLYNRKVVEDALADRNKESAL